MEFIKPDAATYANVLLYGPPKTGKTTGAATAPGAVLYVNADLRNATKYAHGQDAEGRIMEPLIPPFEKGTTPVRDLLREIMVAARQQPTWDTVVIDPIGELYRRMLEEGSGQAKRPSFDHRQDATTDLERFCRFMCEAPVNFVIVAHEMQADGDDGVSSIPFTGSKTGSQSGIGPKIMGMVDVIAYTAAIEVEGQKEPAYVAQLVPGKGRPAGGRFPELMDEAVRPVNLTEWFELVGVHTGGQTPQAVAA